MAGRIIRLKEEQVRKEMDVKEDSEVSDFSDNEKIIEMITDRETVLNIRKHAKNKPIMEVLKNKEATILYAITMCKELPGYLFKVIMRTDYYFIRCGIAASPATPIEVVMNLLKAELFRKNPNDKVIGICENRLSVSEEEWEKIFDQIE